MDIVLNLKQVEGQLLLSYYDLVWYISHGVTLDFKHLNAR